KALPRGSACEARSEAGLSRGDVKIALRIGIGELGDRGPCPVTVPAGGPPRDLWTGIEIHRMGIAAALQPPLHVGRPRHYAAVPAGAGIPPAEGRPRRALLECLDLRLVGEPPILVVHCRPDTIADQPTDGGSGDGSGGAVAGGAANRRADQRSRDRA